MLRDLLSAVYRRFRKARLNRLLDRLYAEAQHLSREGSHRLALAKFREALEFDPLNPVILHEIAHSHLALGETRLAHALLDELISLDESFAPAFSTLSILRCDLGDSAGAEELAIKSLSLGYSTSALRNVQVQLELRRGNAARAAELAKQQWLDDFDSPTLASIFLFSASAGLASSEGQIAGEHFFWGSTAMLPAAPHEHPPHRELPREANGKIRIGYFSGDFRRHSIAFFALPVIEAHCRAGFEVYLYSNGPHTDDITQRFIHSADHFRSIAALPDAEKRDLILADRLDFLVDLSGHTDHTGLHLMRHRLADRQISAFGYPPTTGAPWIDYKLADRELCPPEHQDHYAEQLLFLDQGFWTFRPLQDTPDPNPPPCSTLGYVTFAYFGSLAKLNADTLSAWATIMRQVPQSRLLVKSTHFSDPANRSSFLARATSHGIAESRLSLAPPDSPDELFKAYHDVDVILDSYPYCGGTTSCFAFWMGVPVITLAGMTSLSRMGASMLSRLGLPQLIARSWEEYVSIAVRIGSNPQEISELRSSLRPKFQSSSLGNIADFVLGFESALRRLHAQSGARQASQVKPPRAVSLSAEELSARIDALMLTNQHDATDRTLTYSESIFSGDVALAERRMRQLNFAGRRREAMEHGRATLELNAGTTSPELLSLELLFAELREGLSGDTGAQTAYKRIRANPKATLHTRIVADLLCRRLSARQLEPKHQGERSATQCMDWPTVVVHTDSAQQFRAFARAVRSELGTGLLIAHTRPSDRFEVTMSKLAQSPSSTIAMLSPAHGLPIVEAWAIALAALRESEAVASWGCRYAEGADASHATSVLPVGAQLARNASTEQLMLSAFEGYDAPCTHGMSALGGSLLMFRKSLLSDVAMNASLAASLPHLFTEWTLRCALNGKKLAAVPALLHCADEPELPDRKRWAIRSLCADSNTEVLRMLDQPQRSLIERRAAQVEVDSTEVASRMLSVHPNIGPWMHAATWLGCESTIDHDRCRAQASPRSDS